MLAFFVLPAILSLLFATNSNRLPPSNVLPDDRRVLLVTAHPDDECMFFGPAILALREQRVDVFGLVLSNGNADGLGDLREVEAQESFDVLGVSRDRLFLIDHPQLQDNITQPWRTDLVAGIIHDHVEKLRITDIVTFDRQGVSQHPNHISVCEGAVVFLANFKGLLLSPQQSKEQQLTDAARYHRPRLFVLDSVRLQRKYMGVLAPISTNVVLAGERAIRRVLQLLRVSVAEGSRTTFVATPKQYWMALQAMRKHRSQLVWFRWLYVAFSRYMWVNDLVQVGGELEV